MFGQYNYANYIKGYYKIDSGESNSTSSSDRYRNVLETELDLNGKDSTSTSTFLSRGPMGSNSLVRIRNTGGTDVTLGNANGGQNGLTVYANTTNNITVTEAAGHSSFVEGGTDTGLTAAFTEAHGYYSLGLQQFGSGTTTATTFTHFHAVPSVGTVTNEYAFYAEGGMLSRFGGVILGNLGSDPSTVADSAHIYAKDDAGSSEVYVRDEAGNVTKISPHNTAGEWEYYSVNRNTGKTVRINMERAIKLLEQLTGETLIENQ